MPGRTRSIVAWIIHTAGIRAAELRSEKGLEALYTRAAGV